MRRLTLALAAAGAALPGIVHPDPAAAQTAPAPTAQGDVSVTIYNNNLALVQDVRELRLPAGQSKQDFPDVSAQIRPETVTLSGSGIGIVEQNFDYDLLTPAKLMDKAVGQSVTLVRTNPGNGAETREQAKVLANNGGTIVQIGPRIEVLGGGDRVVFPQLPPNLRARPTLSVTLESASASARPVTLSYLTTGLAWRADYVALFDERAGKIDVQGWITLNNNSGTTFESARTLLVAGTVGQSDDRNSYRPRQPRGNVPGTESANRERLGDFYLYPIAGRTTIANAQQKQVSFLDVSGAAAQRAYAFRNGWLGAQEDAVSADTVLRFSNARAGGLGDALPAGTVRVYMRDARGQPQFVGESGIPHTPMGSSLALKTGEAFDVKVQPTVEKRERISTDEWERSARWRVTGPDGTRTYQLESNVTLYRTTMQYRVTNARPEPVTVEVTQAGLGGWWRDTRVPSESIAGEQLNYDERMWRVTVPANGETRLTVTIDTRY